MASFVYDSAKEHIAKGTIDLVNDVFRIILLAAAHTPDKAAHAVLTDVSGDEISGNGYTAGGMVVAGTVVTRSTATVKFDATDPEFEALAPDFRYAVIYRSYDYNADEADDKLLALLDPGVLQEPAGANTKIVFNAGGIMTLTDG